LFIIPCHSAYANDEPLRTDMLSDLTSLRIQKISTRISIAVPSISKEEESKELSAARRSLDNSEPLA